MDDPATVGVLEPGGDVIGDLDRIRTRQPPTRRRGDRMCVV
jgi:hypothetical protein